MKLFIALPVIVCLGVQALPTAQKQRPEVALPQSTVQIIPAAGSPALVINKPFSKRSQTSTAIEEKVENLHLKMDNAICHLLKQTGLHARNDTIDLLIAYVFDHESMDVFNEALERVKDVLEEHGVEEDKVKNLKIEEVQEMMELDNKSSIEELFSSLNLL